ncbi:hypothetical protein JQ597_04545 [Bradyrhizobium sp. AUGA SZCCT0177]|uniref:hypothetical protein n=1 Tax=Bradyrhizobium sp. AUGA SZCCT0177 TaxID=2807665 RepID=UPI001BAAAF66|nr:hypothetical protein [Bradyrhizobium sp. AUGA SZCCT0177]MBR1281304.1 hypothetical protein [Bradyrhizobium sp. AUGA SZCCT0177]
MSTTFLKCKIVHLGDHETATRYRVTCSDAKTGAFVSSLSLPARPEGGPPSISVGIIAELLDGHRLTSVFIEVEAELWAPPPRHAPGGSIPALPGILPFRPTPGRAFPASVR